MNRKVPRCYQTACFEAIRAAYAKRLKRVIVELATGLGKTVIFVLITIMVLEKKGRVLVLVNRDVLIGQAVIELKDNGVYAQREQAGYKATCTADVVVGSIQSMQNERLTKWPRDYFRMVITDECHGSAAKTFRVILDHFEGSFHLGVTATAERHDKKGLWQGYEDIVYRMPLKNWTERESGLVTPGGQDEGWLVQFEFQELPVPITIDDQLATGKRLTEAEEEGVFEKGGYLPRLFSEGANAAKGAKGLSFFPTCKVSEDAAAHFRDAGVNAQHIEGYMSRNRQRELLEWFAGEKQAVLCNSDLLSVGYNQKDIDWIGLFRLMRSTVIYKQRLGRGSRVVADVDSCSSRDERLAAIAASAKPFCRVTDLMIQNEDHNLATPSCLITDDPEERKALDKLRDKGAAMDMDELDDMLKEKRQQDYDAQRARFAEQAANAALKRQKNREVFIGDILNRTYANDRGEQPSDKQAAFMRSLGVPLNLSTVTITKLQASKIIQRYLDEKAKQQRTLETA